MVAVQPLTPLPDIPFDTPRPDIIMIDPVPTFSFSPERSTRHLPAALVLLVSALLVGCGSNEIREDIGPPLDANGQPIVQPVTIDGPQTGLEIDPNSLAGRAPQERVIYFDYDQSELRTEFLDIVAQHGRYLAQNPEGRVRLEGHTDERGAREYNIALGESRANTVSRMLQLQGVSSAQIRTISYGEELPVDEGHNSEAWAENRRVNVIYETGVAN